MKLKDTKVVLGKINKFLKELKNGVKDSELTNEEIAELQDDLDKAKELALSLKKKFQQ